MASLRGAFYTKGSVCKSAPLIYVALYSIMNRVYLCVLILASIGIWIKPSAAQQPNIVLILVDDLGYGDLSSYGATDLYTPHIDSIIAAGMRFDRFYANSPVCSPTRAALLSGRYPPMVGVPGVVRTKAADNWGYLSEDAVLLPSVLKRAGYHTGMVGKWHLGLEAPNRPHDRGFDEFKGFLGDMMDDYYIHRRHGINYMRSNDTVIDPEGHATDLFSEWAVDYIHSRKPSSAPFFLYLAYNAPHTPIQPPDDWLAKVFDREPEIDEARAKLVALIEHMDDGIGQVMNALEEAGYTDDTVVVFTSDNGGQLNVGANNGGLRDGKQSMYEGGLRVSTGIAWPGHIEAGSRTDYVALSMDLFPTLVEAAGIPINHFIEGQSFLPTLLGQSQEWAGRDLFFSRREGNMRYNGKTVEALLRGNWKLLQNSPYAPQELYNLAEDPKEEHNLTESQPEIHRSMAAALRAHLQEGGKVPWQAR